MAVLWAQSARRSRLPAILWFLSHRWERNSPPAGGEIPLRKEPSSGPMRASGPTKKRSIIAPSSVTASPCHLPPKGKAFWGASSAPFGGTCPYPLCRYATSSLPLLAYGHFPLIGGIGPLTRGVGPQGEGFGAPFTPGFERNGSPPVKKETKVSPMSLTVYYPSLDGPARQARLDRVTGADIPGFYSPCPWMRRGRTSNISACWPACAGRQI